MSITKYKASTKGKKSNKWYSYLYMTKFDNGGMQLKITKKQLEKLLEDIKKEELVFDDYESISFNLFEDKPYVADQATKNHYQAKGNGYQPQSDVHDLNDIPF